MVSQHKLISHPRACASPSPQICRRHAVCICSSSIFNAMHGTYPFELSPPCYYCEFNLEVLYLRWEKECFCLLISLFFSLSLYPSPSLSSILLFFSPTKVDGFYLVPNRWDVLGSSSWLAKCSGSSRYLTCMTPSRAWLVQFPRASASLYDLISLQISLDKCPEKLGSFLASPNTTSQSRIVVTTVPFATL